VGGILTVVAGAIAFFVPQIMELGRIAPEEELTHSKIDLKEQHIEQSTPGS
jgi:hypothetical protein